MRKSIKAIAVTGAAVLGISTVGIGWAYFTESTNASASGGANANMQALAQSDATYVYDTADNKLWPGHAADVRIPLTNNNPVAVEVMTVTAGAVTSNCGDLTPSATTWAVIDGNGNAVANKQVPTGATYTLVITDGVGLDSDATNACEAQGFSTAWTITAENR